MSDPLDTVPPSPAEQRRSPLALPPAPVTPVPADQMRYLPQIQSVRPPQAAVPPLVRTYLRLVTGGLTVIAIGSVLLAALIILWLMDPPSGASLMSSDPDAALDNITSVVTILAGMAIGGLIIGLVAWLTAKA
jgi:hypothetical protein